MFHIATIAPLGNEDSTVIKWSLAIVVGAIAEPLHVWLIISGPCTEDSVILMTCSFKFKKSTGGL